MARKYDELRAKMSPEARAKSEALTREMSREIHLNRLRAARNITQKQVAETLGTDQANISRLERRRDMHLSTLRNFVEAIGGELEIFVKFPDGRMDLDALIVDLEKRS